jgi:cobalt/nickel transport protein
MMTGVLLTPERFAMRRWTALTLLVLLVGCVPLAQAHYNMLLPSTAFAKKGEKVTFTYEWGHPFEHELFDAPRPQSLSVAKPNREVVSLMDNLEKDTVNLPRGGTAVVYRVSFTPDERGDYLFVLQTEPIWLEEEEIFVQDTVKVILHVQAQKGWERTLPRPMELKPLTRPYGLLPGVVFQAQAWAFKETKGSEKKTPSPLGGIQVEIERYNSSPPREPLPADEFITRTTRTDPNGVVTTTLPEAGWWGLTAFRAAGTHERKGKKYELRQRSTLWVYVHERPVSK